MGGEIGTSELLFIMSDDHAAQAISSEVNLVDFIDEWVSAPYEYRQGHRIIILDGLGWIEGGPRKRFKQDFCDDIRHEPSAAPKFKSAVADVVVIDLANPATVLMDSRLVYFNKPVDIELNGSTITRRFAPSLKTFCEILARRGDQAYAFAAEFTVEKDAGGRLVVKSPSK